MPIKKKQAQDGLMARLITPKKKKVKEISENDVKKKIREYLNEFGSELTHLPYSSFGGKAGVSDRLVCYKGHFIGIEAKRPSRKSHKNGGQSDAQRQFEKDVRSAGGHYILAYNVEDVKNYFKEKQWIR